MWKDLTMSQRAEVIQMAVNNGMRDLNQIRSFYDESIRSRRFGEGGSIHIDPSKKGTFTAAASKHGKSVQEFASQVLAHPENYSPAMRKKANFARNSRKWKHDLGGPIVEATYSYQTGGGLKRKAGYKAGDKAGTDQCATWSNGVLRANNYGVYGNAWNLTGVDPVFNGYEGLRRPDTYNKDSVEMYNHAATSNVFKNFDSKTLDKSIPYVVNMFYNGSPYQETAYNEGTGVAGTHTGLLTWEGDDKNGQWMVTHNINDKIHQEPFLSLQSKQNKYGVTAISSPKKSLGLAIKNFFGY